MAKSDYIYGIHAVNALLQNSPQRINCLYVLHGRHDKRLQQLLASAEQHTIAVKITKREELDKLAAAGNHQGVVAECATQQLPTDLPSFIQQLDHPAFLLILDGVQDPHNLGACMRTANAAGVDAVIIPKDKAVGLTPVVRKVASGAAEVTPLFQVTNLQRSLAFLKEQGIWLYATSDTAEQNIYQADLTGAIALVLGAEGKGIRRLTQQNCDYHLRIPMQGSVSSLNVSAAAAVVIYEALRQRH